MGGTPRGTVALPSPALVEPCLVPSICSNPQVGAREARRAKDSFMHAHFPRALDHVTTRVHTHALPLLLGRSVSFASAVQKRHYLGRTFTPSTTTGEWLFRRFFLLEFNCLSTSVSHDRAILAITQPHTLDKSDRDLDAPAEPESGQGDTKITVLVVLGEQIYSTGP